MAVKILQNNTESFDKTTGRSVQRAEIIVDTVDELPAVDGLGGVILSQGSAAWVVNGGVVYGLNSDGEWKLQGV